MIPQLDLLRIGATQGAMATLRSLGFDYAPRTRYQPYARLLDKPTGDGKRVRRGFPRAWWSFVMLTVSQLEIFTDLLGGEESATVYVTTLEETVITSEQTVGDYIDFSALMHISPDKTWGPNEQWHDVTIEFTRLQEV